MASIIKGEMSKNRCRERNSRNLTAHLKKETLRIKNVQYDGIGNDSILNLLLSF